MKVVLSINGLSCYLIAGDRHEMMEDGIVIKNITMADDGEYTCRAEVETDGRYDERKIIVAVHSKSPGHWISCLSSHLCFHIKQKKRINIE